MESENAVHFSILKQKIIKTDEILRMYLETSNKLKKTQQVCKEIRLQYDQTVINFNRIQLEHERCTFSLENLKQRNDLLDKENRELREQKSLLEEQYNQQTVQSQLSIKGLEDELKMLHEIKYSTENWSRKKRRAAINPDKSQIHFNKEHQPVSNESEVINEEHLNTSIISNTQDHQIICKNQPVKESTQNICTQTYKSDIERRTVLIQTVETLKTLQLRDVIFVENTNLKRRILECEAEILKLKATCKPMKKSAHTQTEEIEIDDDFVKFILKEMSLPILLSPMSHATNENLNLKNMFSTTDMIKSFSDSSIIPEVVTPSDPAMEKDIEQVRDFITDEKLNQNTKVEDTSRNGSCGTIEEFCREDNIGRRNKYRLPVTRNEFVKLRKSQIKKLINKKHMLSKEIRKIKKLRKQDYLLKALCALKHSKIKFTISNDTILPKFCSSKDFVDIGYAGKDHFVETTFGSEKKFESSYLTEELNCECKRCNHSNMLLNNIHGEKHLLGFYNIKNEVTTPASSRMDSIRDPKLFDTTKLINTSSNSSKITHENVLEMLADIVIRKLDGREKNILRRKKILSDQSDTFTSGTETEIERLFNKSNSDILKRNKMLLETAKQQNKLISNLTTEKIELENKHTNKEMREFDSNIVPLIKEIEDFSENMDPLYKTNESEYYVCQKDSSQTYISGNTNNENVENFNFSFPEYPQLLSPINSIKNFDISTKKDVKNLLKCEEKGLYEDEETSALNVTHDSSYQLLSSSSKNNTNNYLCFASSLFMNKDSCQEEVPSGAVNTKLLTTVQYKRNSCSPNHLCSSEQDSKKLYNEEAKDVNSYFTKEKPQDICRTRISKTSIDHNIYTVIKHMREFPQAVEENPVLIKSNNPLLNDNIQQLVHPVCSTGPIKKLVNRRSSDSNSISLLSDNSEVHIMEDKIDFKDVPSCPESPIPDGVNVQDKCPIIIPLEKIDRHEKIQEVDTFLTSLEPNNQYLTSTSSKMVRRSKRISEKNISKSSKYKNSGAGVDNLIKTPRQSLPEELLNRISNVDNTNPIKVQLEDINTAQVSKDSIEAKEISIITLNTKRKKCTNKLKSRILRQVREKRQIFRTNPKFRMFQANDKSLFKDGKLNDKLTMDNNKNDNKIHIVQNILISANSGSVVDLMKENESTEVAESCDIRLDRVQNSSQTNTAVSNVYCNKKKNYDSICNNVPNKKKRTVCVKTECDVLSKIINEMDKDRPKIILPQKITSSSSKPIIPDSADEKQWRKGVLVIADNIHDITPKPNDLINNTFNGHKIYNPKFKPTLKTKILLTRLLKLSSEEKIPDEIVLEFKRQDVNNIAEMILQKVSRDVLDKPDNKYYPAPLMTRTQRIFLGLMVRLEQENVENVMDAFLSKTEAFLFKIGCGIRALIPITRLYMAVCKLRRDIDKIRIFCCNAFLFMGDLAVPLFFTVLTSWTEVLPMESSVKSYRMAKILIQVVHLKNCNLPGYNLLPLKFLFSQFYGYPKERWNCDEMFEELFQEYLKNPDKSSDIAIRLLCRNKDTKWVYTKINQFFKPLIYKIPSENVNFKATVIILIGNVCRHFKPNNELDESSLNDVRRWLIGLTEEENVPDLIKKSVDLSLSKLPKKKMKVKKIKNKCGQRTTRQKKTIIKCRKRKKTSATKL